MIRLLGADHPTGADGLPMIYRMRIYKPDAERLETSHKVFYDWVLPVHQKHGARLVGRWQSEDGRIVVLWEYDSRADCERVQRAVRDDVQSQGSEAERRAKGLLDVEREEWLMTSTSDKSPSSFE